jgi:flagellar protein FliL
MADTAETTSADKKAGGKKKILIIGLAVACLAGGGGGAWFFLKGSNASSAAAAPAPRPPVFLPLDAFTVNLQKEERDHIAQVVITLQMEDAQSSEAIKLHMPEVRNRILIQLTSKSASSLYSTQGKELLAQELVAALNQPFVGQAKQPKALGIFFTSFLIQ